MLVHWRNSHKGKREESRRQIKEGRDEWHGGGVAQILCSFTVVLRTLIFNLGERKKNHWKVLSRKVT